MQSAIEENSRYIDEQRAEIAKVRATNFEHRYTECDYADLQFMQNTATRLNHRANIQRYALYNSLQS